MATEHPDGLGPLSSRPRVASRTRTAALNLFVVVEGFYLFSCRSLTHSVWHVGVFSNRWIIGGVTVQVLGQLSITYLPFMNTALQTEPITSGTWLGIVAVVASFAVAADKRLRRQAP